MIKRPVKKAAKRLLRSVRAIVQRLEEEPSAKPEEKHDFYQDEFAYPWLNSIFSTLLIEGAGALRPSYTWGVLHGVHLARALGINRVSVIEFGVAGGNGLLSLERAAERIGAILGVAIDVYGFDTGAGLPTPLDYRDLPNLYTERSFPMDVEAIRKRLSKAHLILGSVESTISDLITSRPAPVAFISFDLDYYSSTMHAFKLLEADQALLLPRIHCYFDDMMGFTFSEYTGERLAISEFNGSHALRKISPIYGLRYLLPPPHNQAEWAELIYMVHIFDHHLYGQKDGLVRAPHASALALKDG